MEGGRLGQAAWGGHNAGMCCTGDSHEAVRRRTAARGQMREERRRGQHRDGGHAAGGTVGGEMEATDMRFFSGRGSEYDEVLIIGRLWVVGL